ncbi:beta-ketoacyl synthase N-terminal-like domain-containing protein [Paenibacillus sp. IHBB 10380]|uniref:beta-ketoacyl synthase N-terminal-like domain-containing protein n=1 Tax=Paenibacillus sp. IHBB 10380 TaxID=1566358 RepID=UPI000698408E|nr:beta-ketoacyl synthase N-terminal-like domain-containing protein [Paenibacillus sp. IHBB 10380]
MKLSELKKTTNLKKDTDNIGTNQGISIIGIDCSIGNAQSTHDFWNHLKNKVDFIGAIDSRREKITNDILSLMQEDGSNSHKLQMCYLRDIDQFDYSFFGIAPKEASMIDPAQKLLLQSVYRCLEDSNVIVDKYRGMDIGVFIGYDDTDLVRYKDVIYKSNPEMYNMAIPGNHTAIISGRISDYFDFNGPTYVVNTACSSSMSALHLASTALKNGECSLAIVCSINFTLTPVENKNFILGIEASDGRTKTFNDNSNGTGKGEGIISLLLKPYKKAIEERDAIYAVIKGSAVGHDGKSSSLTSPNVNAQADVLRKAWDNAQINPRELTYIEAHGTGTKIGDPIEVEAINQAVSSYTDEKMFCAIGSVKSNIGHLNGAAGLAGILKTALCLYHKELVPTLHFHFPNSNIDFFNTPLYVCCENKKIIEDVMYAGVSSFGLSGTNCHVVMKNHHEQRQENIIIKNSYEVLALSAKTENSLRSLVREYSKFLVNASEEDLFSICYTANTCRQHYPFRKIFVVSSIRELRCQMFAYIYSLKTHNEDIFFSNVSYDITHMDLKGLLVNNKLIDLNRILALCDLYMGGAEINWNSCYAPYSFSTVHIPTYQFEKTSCFWNSETLLPSSRRIGGSYCYKATWVPVQQDSLSHRDLADTVVIIYSSTNLSLSLSQRLIKKLRCDNRKVITVKLEENISGKTSMDSFIYSSQEEKYTELLAEIGSSTDVSVIFLATLQEKFDYSLYEKYLSSNIYTLNDIYRAFNTLKQRLRDFICIGDYGDNVTGDEGYVNPYNGALYEYIKGIQAENMLFPETFRSIDVCNDVTFELLCEAVEIKGSGKYALRNGRIFIETVARNKELEEVQMLHDGDVYVITGGFSENVLHLCRTIAERVQVTFYLLSRSVEQHLEKKNVNLIISNIKELGSTVFYKNCNVSSAKEVNTVLNTIRGETGQNISGIIHCAGVESVGVLSRKSRSQIQAVLGPKVMGCVNLHQSTKADNLSFFLMFSSMSSFVPTPGQADYAYANKFMDIYSQIIAGDARKVLSINWPAFKDAGMAVRNMVNFERMVVPALSFKALADLCLFALEHAEGQVIVSNSVISFELDENNRFNDYEVTSSNELSDFPGMTALQKSIATIWSKVLGIRQIGLDDEFTSLGGNSISAIQLALEIEKKYKIVLDENFQYSVMNIRQTAELIEQMSGENKVVLNAIEPFNQFLFINCFYSSLFSVLSYYKVPVSSFICKYKAYADWNDGRFDIKYNAPNDFEEIMSSLGLAVNVQRKLQDCFEPTITSLQNGHPVILSVDCFYLPIRSDMYQRIHCEHSLLVIGYEKSKEIFYVLEQKNAESLSYQKQEIKFEDMKAAYNGYQNNFGTKSTIEFMEVFPLEEDEIRSVGAAKTVFDESFTRTKEIIDLSLQYINSIDSFDISEKERDSRFLHMLNQCISYIQAQSYINNELYQSDDYGLLLAQMNDLYLRSRVKLVKNNLIGESGEKVRRNMLTTGLPNKIRRLS